MAAQPLRNQTQDPREPVVHDLPPIRFEGTLVSIRLSVRHAEDGVWRGRLGFLDTVAGAERESAEIFCGPSEQELWQSVRDLRDHHFRDLYRSLA